MTKIQLILCLLLIRLCTACTEEMMDETAPVPFEKGLEEVAMSLQCMPVQIVGDEWSALPDTRVADAGIKDDLISNIWVFQYDKSGSQITVPRYYVLPANKVGSAVVNVMLRPATDCQIYIVANTNNNAWLNKADVSTLDKLKKLTHTFASENDVYGGTNKNLLMSGGISATVKAGQANALGSVPLKRMLAMITFQYRFATADLASKLKVTRITLNNVPNQSQVGEPTGVYPSAVSNPIEYAVVTSPVAETFYTGYVPENLRGVISNTDEKSKNEKAPEGAISIKLYIDSEMDGGSYVYTVYPGENNYNDFNIKRNNKYTLTLNLKSSSTDSRVMAAPANCFVMKQGSSIVFDPYERTETGGGWRYADYVDKLVDSKKFSRVDILWQTGDGSKFAIGNNAGTTKKVYLKDDKVYVTAGNTDGNAVIAGYNSSGVILWSWHIWVNNSSPAQVANAVKYTTYNWDSSTIYTGTRVPGYDFMACNLGATSTSKGDINTFGLYYQWGRKDPFPQTARKTDAVVTFYSNAYPNVTTVYDNAAQQLPMSSTAGGAGEVFQTRRIDQLGIGQTGAESIHYSIQHPTVFMATVTPALFENGGESSGQPGPGNGSTHDPAYYVNDGDWYWGHNDKLWGGVPFDDATVIYPDAATPIVANNGAEKKSLFDPCPSGWMLPKSDAWMGFTSTGLNTSAGSADAHMTYQNYENYGMELTDLGMLFYMQAWRSGPTSLFPLCGWRTGDGSCFVVKQCGGYYTSAASYHNASSILHIHPSLVNPYDYGYQYARRSCAYPIRCVREVK